MQPIVCKIEPEAKIKKRIPGGRKKEVPNPRSPGHWEKEQKRKSEKRDPVTPIEGKLVLPNWRDKYRTALKYYNHNLNSEKYNLKTHAF